MNKHLDTTLPHFTSIDVFCGGGGASCGIHKAGFSSVLCIDVNTNALECLKANYTNVPILQKPVQYITAKEVFKITGLKQGQLDHLHGSPPCQSYSTANSKAAANPPENANVYFYEFIRLIDELKPKTFTAENVDGMMKGAKRPYFNNIIKKLHSLTDYEFKYKTVNCALYGVPQDRKRVIFIGKRKDIAPNEPICFPNPNAEATRFLTVKMVAPHIEWYDPCQFKAPMKDNTNLMCTIIATDRMQVKVAGKWRGMTIAEMKMFMGFPDSYVMPSKSRHVNVRILGNAVPPPMMYSVMLCVRKLLSEHGKGNEANTIYNLQ